MEMTSDMTSSKMPDDSCQKFRKCIYIC